MYFDIETDDDKEDTIWVVIEHTNQSWAIEILNILKNKIEQTVENPRKSLKWAQAYKSFVKPEMGLALAPMGFFLLLAFMSDNYSGQRKEGFNYQIATSIEKTDNIRDVGVSLIASMSKDSETLTKLSKFDYDSTKLKDALQVAAKKSSEIERQKGILILSFWAGVVALIIARFYADYYIKHHKNKSFILITPKAEKLFEEEKEEKRTSNFIPTSTVIFTLVMGLLINFITQIFNTFSA